MKINTRSQWPLLIVLLCLTSFHSLAQGGSLPFIIEVTVNANDSFTIPTTGTGYNYDVNWGDGSSDTSQTGDATHTYSTAGVYQVSISGDFPRIYFYEATEEDRADLTDIIQWGDIAWTSMGYAFYDCDGLSTITASDTLYLALVTDFSYTFANANSFNGDLSKWNVSNGTNFSYMFHITAFSGDISGWNVLSGTNFSFMFSQCPFNINISSWDVDNGTNFSGMFSLNTAFNQDLTWNVSNGISFASMFNGATAFNGNISSWDVLGGTNFQRMFANASSFNGDLSNWEVDNGTNFSFMFSGASIFNSDLSLWNVDNGTNFGSMFLRANQFNRNLSSWNVGQGTNFSYMFHGAHAFNQNISGWNVASGTTFRGMFKNTTAFDQDLSAWDIGAGTDFYEMFSFCAISAENYSATLIGWSTLGTGETTIPSNMTLGAHNVEYCTQDTTIGRPTLIDTYGWTFSGDIGIICGVDYDGDGYTDYVDCNDSIATIYPGAPEILDGLDNDCDGYADEGFGDEFVTKWVIDSQNLTVTIPTTGTGYNYSINWGDGSSVDSSVTGDYSHTYTSPGTYFIEISGDFPRIYFYEATPQVRAMLIDVVQWGNIAWTSMNHAFYDCDNLATLSAPDSINLDSVSDFSYTFAHSDNFNGDVSNWNVSNGTNFSYMFHITAFNGDVSGWNVSNGTNFSYMFSQCPFNGNITNWSVSNGTIFDKMFQLNTAFNQDLNWNVSNGISFASMFNGATAFNGNISSWDVLGGTNFMSMFKDASSFSGDLSLWKVDSGTNFSFMFSGDSAFNSDLSGWNVANGTDFGSMFLRANQFNRNLSSWNVGKGTNFSYMFHGAHAFNSDISGWDVASGTSFRGMFKNTSVFDQDLSAWDIGAGTDFNEMFSSCPISADNYSATLNGWATLGTGETTIPSNMTLGAVNVEYCTDTGRQTLINTYGWTIQGDIYSCPARYFESNTPAVTPAFSFYPNPAHGVVNIAGAQLAGSTVTLYDMQGKLVLSESIVENGQAEINTQNLKEGMYILHLISQDGALQRERLVISH